MVSGLPTIISKEKKKHRTTEMNKKHFDSSDVHWPHSSLQSEQGGPSLPELAFQKLQRKSTSHPNQLARVTRGPADSLPASPRPRQSRPNTQPRSRPYRRRRVEEVGGDRRAAGDVPPGGHPLRRVVAPALRRIAGPQRRWCGAFLLCGPSQP